MHTGIMSDVTREAYGKGWEAFMLGGLLTANPYPIPDNPDPNRDYLYQYWDEGYADARVYMTDGG